jgi:hypothetical protein
MHLSALDQCDPDVDRDEPADLCDTMDAISSDDSDVANTVTVAGGHDGDEDEGFGDGLGRNDVCRERPACALRAAPDSEGIARSQPGNDGTHHLPRGRPSSRSAMMLRWISAVPALMVKRRALR